MPDNPSSAPKRCAIYTRKSTNSRLDHEVNSLTTQHEICAAYIASQGERDFHALSFPLAQLWFRLARQCYQPAHREIDHRPTN